MARKFGIHCAGIDLDGTLAEATWYPGCDETVIGEPIEANMIKMWELFYAGYSIVIHTARPASHRDLIRDWLNDNQIPWYEIVTDKPLCAVYCDDRARHADEAHWFPHGSVKGEPPLEDAEA